MLTGRNRCPCCGSDSSNGRAALVSPFLADYLFGRPVGLCSVNECGLCSLVYYSPRLTDEEVARLYQDYRGEAYYRVRHKYEFWYTRRHNSKLGDETQRSERRREFLAAVGRHAAGRDIGSVLDYGGDRGQLLVEGPGLQRVVFDPSGVEPLPGIEQLTSEQSLVGRRFDLVVLAHVLEHASAPTALLAKLRGLVSPGGLIFVAVPDEHFPLGDLPAGPWYRRYLECVRRFLPLTVLVDFYSTAVRVKLHRIPPLGFAKLHEHQNLFTPSALAHCLNLAGFRVLEHGGAGEIIAVGEAAD